MMSPSDVQAFIDRYFASPNDDVDMLILAGDIGDPRSRAYEQILWASSRCYKRVFVVHGNHEYYGHNDESLTLPQLPDNMIVLDRTLFETDSYIITGCTLWTPIAHQHQAEIVKCINDFSQIQGHTVDSRKTLYDRDVAWLDSVLCGSHSSPQQKQVIVVTHMLPSFTLIHPDYWKYSHLNSAFACQCDDLVQLSNIWLYGHSHKTNVAHIGNTLLACNPVGYVGENKNPRILRIDTETQMTEFVY